MTGQHIVVGYDGSESSRAALTYALRAAGKHGWAVLVAHVGFAGISSVGGTPIDAAGSHDELMAAERELVRTVVEEARAEAPTVDVSSQILSGAPAPALIEAAEGAEMVVVGSRGLGTFAGLAVGSTSQQLASHAPCPVVVVRPTGYLPLGPEAGRVVVGVDGSSGSAKAIEFAFEEAAARRCGLTAVYAWQVPSFEAFGWMMAPTSEEFLPLYDHDARVLLAEAMAGWGEKYPGVEVRRECVRGNTVAVLVNASAGAQLTVVGSRGAGGFASLVLGSVSHALVQHAHSAVAVVPHAAAERAASTS